MDLATAAQAVIDDWDQDNIACDMGSAAMRNLSNLRAALEAHADDQQPVLGVPETG